MDKIFIPKDSGKDLFRKKYPKYFRLVSDIYNSFEDKPYGDVTMGCTYTFYANILDHIIKNRPKSIIEYGPGVTTYLIEILLLELNYDCKFVSFEDDQYWYNQLKDQGLDPHDNVELVKLKWFSKGENNFTEYQHDYERFKDVDFIILDGPGKVVQNDIRYDINYNLHKLVDYAGQTINCIVDGRKSTQQYYNALYDNHKNFKGDIITENIERFYDMNIITGEKIQSLCDNHISKKEHTPFEFKKIRHIDVDEFDFAEFDNKELVYCNSSLVNSTKPKLVESKLYDKLLQFKNPFKLILHNSDQNFGENQLKYLDIPNCKKIYTQNMNVIHKDVIPLPIGIANSFWKWGKLNVWENILKEDIQRDKFIYCNFTISGGVRDEKRKSCYETILKNDIEFLPNMEYEKYLRLLGSYKYSISPQGNGIDCFRMWESLYLKVIPICERSILTEHFSKMFPIVLLDKWEDLDVNELQEKYEDYNNWDNYYKLDFIAYTNYIGL